MTAPLLVIALCVVLARFWTNLTADYDGQPELPVRSIEVHTDPDGTQTITYGQRLTPLDTDWARDLPMGQLIADDVDAARQQMPAAEVAPVSPAPAIGRHALERLRDPDDQMRINGAAAQWSAWVDRQTSQYNLDDLFAKLSEAREVAA